MSELEKYLNARARELYPKEKHALDVLENVLRQAAPEAQRQVDALKLAAPEPQPGAAVALERVIGELREVGSPRALAWASELRTVAAVLSLYQRLVDRALGVAPADVGDTLRAELDSIAARLATGALERAYSEDPL
jgi:hypothetical protein